MRSIGRVLTIACLALIFTIAHAETIVHTFQSAGRPIVYEVFNNVSDAAPLLILLPGASGPDAESYRLQASYFSHHGYKVFLLHYFDATSSHLPTDRNYEVWTRALEDLVHDCSEPTSLKRSIYVVGDSLGASIALAAGSQGLSVQAIAEWYGSLPDTFFYRFRTMPPLLILHGALDRNIPVSSAAQLIRLCKMKSLSCVNHIYADQNHGFSGAVLEDAEQRTIAFFTQH